MANRANGTVTIDVSARLQVMQSSVNELQKTLDTLEPKSARFKELSGVIQQIKREMDKVQVQTAKGFVSESQFKQTEKSLDNIEDAFAKAQLSISRIDFKDIKLDSNQLATFKQFEQDLVDIKTQLAATKQGIRDAFVNDAGNKAFLNSIDPTLVNKSLDQIQTAVESKMRSVNKEMQRAEEAVANYQKQIQAAADIDKFLKAGKKGNKKQGTLTYSLENALGGDAYQEFFNSNGQFKKGQRDAFFQRIQEMFMLDNAQMEQIKKLSGAKINQLFSEIIEQANSKDGTNWFDAQVKAAAKANANIANQQGIVSAKSAESQQLINFIQQLILATDQQASADDAAARAAQIVQQAMDSEAASIAKNTKDKAQNGLATDQLSNQLNNLRQELAQTNVQFNKQQQAINTIQSIRSAITNFMGFNQVLNITRNAVREAANHIRELDKVMTSIAIVTDMTQADLWGQIDTYSKMASQYGTSIQGAYEVSQIWYQQGLQTQDVMSLTNETLKMSKISGLDYANATDYMTTAIRGFKMELSEANTVVDVYSALAASTAVSTQELAEAMTRTASSMESVGSSFQETSAMMATVIAVTRESANNIGSAFKSIASRYGEMKSDPSKLVDSEGEELAFNKVDAALKSVGITMKTTDGQFRSFTEVIMELADRWDTLTSVQQRYYLVA